MGSGQVALRLKGALLPSVHSRGVSSPAGAARPPIRERRSRKQATRLERVLRTARGGLGGARAPRVCRARGQRPDGTAASDRRWDRSPRVRAPFTQGDGGAFWPRV